MSRSSKIRIAHRTPLAIVGALLAATAATVGLGVAPASAATPSVGVTFQTFTYVNHPWKVRSLAITGQDGAKQCVNFEYDHVGSDGETLWSSETPSIAQGRDSVTSFDARDCPTGHGLAGSTGTIDTHSATSYTVYAIRTPKARG